MTTGDVDFNCFWDDYSSVSGIIETVVSSTIYKCRIPDIPPEDLGQEVRFKCFQAMHKFDPSRIGPSPFRYLKRVAENHIYNLRRGIWVPNNSPCNRCELWDVIVKKCTISEVGCEAIVNYRQKMAAKASLRTAVETEIEQSDSAQTDLEARQLNDHFRAKLPPNLLSDYEKLINGDPISPNKKAKLRKLIAKIINETL